MKKYELAKSYDVSGDLAAATKLYEESIKIESSISAYVNLAFIYWEISEDFGMQDYVLVKNIFRQDEIINFGERYKEVLASGLQKHPESAELQFWINYTQNFGNESQEENCKFMQKLAKLDATLFEPFFYLYVFCGHKDLEERVLYFANKIKNLPTSKERYLLSYL